LQNNLRITTAFTRAYRAIALYAGDAKRYRENNIKMADTRPTKLKFIKIVFLCFLAIFSPEKFIEEEKKDNQSRKNFTLQEKKPHQIYSVVKAFWISLVVIILSAILGTILGFILKSIFANPSPCIISFLQIAGACLLLWGTLFIRGWEIQTYCGVTLTERVNQWLYRGLYCIGTTLIICSLIWA